MKKLSRAQAWSRRTAYAVALCATFSFIGVNSALAASGGKDPGPAPAFNGVSLAVRNSTIPPGGMFQFQLMLTEPKPMGTASTRPTTGTSTRGISLYDPIGITAGVAVLTSSGPQINAISPTGTYGLTPNSDYPILTISTPIPTDAVVGTQYTLGMDLGNSFFLDPTGQPYPTELKTGTLTIGGTMAISDVVPGGGFQPAGTRIAIFGMGFTPASTVDFSAVALLPGDFEFVSPSEMDVILPQGVVMDGNRVRVKNGHNEVSTYFSYLRANVIGQSTHPLVAHSEALFSRLLYTNATLNWNRSGTNFTALAVQNPGTTAAEITVNMLSSSGQVLGSISFPLAAYSKITRDLLELFPQPPDTAVSVQVRSTQSVQVMGLLGDDASGNVVPVIASGQ